MNSIDKLSEIFKHFPGIGPRQAKRFVYYLLSRDKATLKSLSEAIGALSEETTQCEDCRRYFCIGSPSKTSPKCTTCEDESRDPFLLMIVPRDADFESVEKSGGFHGYYFVLGGVLPILEKEPEKRIRIAELKKLLKKKEEVKEVILAMNANSDGENTAEFLKDEIRTLKPDISVSTLGRGLSTGAELEYADPDTLKNALLHRTK
ncbi:MAG: toprim domain-containing protein, partial [Parcubacteria group bacterium]